MNKVTTIPWRCLQFIAESLSSAYSKGFFHFAAARYFIQFLSFLLIWALHNYLSAEDIGRVRIFQAYQGIFLIISCFGFNVSVLKLCSETREKTERQILFSNALVLVLLFAILFCSTAFILAFIDLYSKDPVINSGMVLYIWTLPFLSLSTIVFSYIQALKKIRMLSYLQMATRLLILIAIIGLSVLFYIQGFIIGSIVGAALEFFILILIIKNHLTISLITLSRDYLIKLFQFGKFALLANLMGQALVSTDIILLNFLLKDRKIIGFYGVAQLFILGIRQMANVINQIAIPYLSEWTNDKPKLIELYKQYNLRLILMMVLSIGIAFFLLPLVIKVFFASEYQASIKFVRILLVGVLFWSLYSPKGITLLSIGRVDYNFFSYSILLVINIILNYVFISNWGATGAACATSFTYFVGIPVIGYYFRKAIK